MWAPRTKGPQSCRAVRVLSIQVHCYMVLHVKQVAPVEEDSTD